MRNIHAMNIHRVNLRTFDLNLLRVLDALLTEPQVSAAARRLNLSQPATSAALLRLRNALADPLLVRVGNQMALTRLAEALRPKVRRLVAEIELTLGAPPDFDPATSERALRIAANDHAVVAVVSPLLQRLRRIAPRMRTEVLPFEDDFERRLAEGNYDVAVRDRWSMRTWRSLETLFNEDYVCIARSDHPRLSRKPTLKEFLAEGHVLIAPSGGVPGVVDKALERQNYQRRVAVTLPHFLAAPAIVATTDYVMTIARRIALQAARTYKLSVFPPPVRLTGFDVVMAWHPRGEGDAATAWLRDQIRQTSRQLAVGVARAD
jgi:DNA-binding transcriptional LysR family regulator